jgi:molybdopterin synthase catalytic subunit
MEIEHYPGMTERAIAAIAEEARARWSLADVLVIHRHGPLAPGEAIMMVATAARHRTAAFEAAEFLMDYLKSRAPFWKKEFGPDGAGWVAAKDEDEDALARW